MGNTYMERWLADVGSAFGYTPPPTKPTWAASVHDYASKLSPSKPKQGEWLTIDPNDPAMGWAEYHAADPVPAIDQQIDRYLEQQQAGKVAASYSQQMVGDDPQKIREFLMSRHQAVAGQPMTIRRTSPDQEMRRVYGDAYGDRLRNVILALNRPGKLSGGEAWQYFINPLSMRANLHRPLYEFRVPSLALEVDRMGNSGYRYIAGVNQNDQVWYAAGAQSPHVRNHEHGHAFWIPRSPDPHQGRLLLAFFSDKPGDPFSKPKYNNSRVEAVTGEGPASVRENYAVTGELIDTRKQAEQYVQRLIDEHNTPVQVGVDDPVGVFGGDAGKKMEGFGASRRNLGGQLKRATDEEREQYIRMLPMLMQKSRTPSAQVS